MMIWVALDLHKFAEFWLKYVIDLKYNIPSLSLNKEIPENLHLLNYG